MTPQITALIEEARRLQESLNWLTTHQVRPEQLGSFIKTDANFIAFAANNLMALVEEIERQGELSKKSDYAERVAQLTAHRAVGGEEHDPSNSKLHGCCAVCVVPWPCEIADVSKVADLQQQLTSANERVKELGVELLLRPTSDEMKQLHSRIADLESRIEEVQDELASSIESNTQAAIRIGGLESALKDGRERK